MRTLKTTWDQAWGSHPAVRIPVAPSGTLASERRRSPAGGPDIDSTPTTPTALHAPSPFHSAAGLCRPSPAPRRRMRGPSSSERHFLRLCLPISLTSASSSTIHVGCMTSIYFPTRDRHWKCRSLSTIGLTPTEVTSTRLLNPTFGRGWLTKRATDKTPGAWRLTGGAVR
jgi:hypothetical protein